MKKILNLINGNLTNKSNKFLPVDDPSTGEKIAEVVKKKLTMYNRMGETEWAANNVQSSSN